VDAPSIAAAANGKAQVLPLLAKRKADLSLCTSAGRSALHWACCKGHLEAARALLAAGANAKAVDNSGLSCLHRTMLST
jgi:ankyrin repeat protein